jgi:general L-amino acid transport system permease protein
MTTPRRRWAWVRRHLLRGPADALATVVFGSLGVFGLYRLASFVFGRARWEIVMVNLKLLLVGRWPDAHLLRIAVAVGVMVTWLGLIAGYVGGRRARRGSPEDNTRRWLDLGRRFGLIAGAVLLLLSLTTTAGPWLMVGAALAGALVGTMTGRAVGLRIGSMSSAVGWFGLLALVPVVIYLYLVDAVPLAEWEGFLFNLTAAAAGIVLCFPLGVVLALGRRSRLPLLKTLSVLYIELVRGSPLYVLLLLANVSLEFFVPPDLAPSKVVRAVVTFTVFTAAYLAEIVRGGLQSVPAGQVEAAKALGLSPFKQMGLVVLPQALRNVIPAQIGQFISLFKDTTLAGLSLGILELLGGAQAITQQDAFRGQGLIVETVVFAAFLLWVGSFTMSRESQRLERRLGVGTR